MKNGNNIGATTEHFLKLFQFGLVLRNVSSDTHFKVLNEGVKGTTALLDLVNLIQKHGDLGNDPLVCRVGRNPSTEQSKPVKPTGRKPTTGPKCTPQASNNYPSIPPNPFP